MKSLRWVAALLIALLATPTAAQAFDIPLLTWERGRVQQVVLGGGAYTDNWVVTLEGEGVAPLTFTRSETNDAGYVVYSLNLPSDLPIGAYSVQTSGENAEKTLVAGVNLVQSQTKTASSNLIDLTIIISIFVFLTTIISTLRSKKYSTLTTQNSQFSLKNGLADYGSEISFAQRLSNAPYRIRINGLSSIRISLLQFLMVREGELLHRTSRQIYGVLPLLGLLAGSIAGIEVNRNSGIANTGIAIFIAVSVLAIFDAFSGLFATLGFWFIQLVTGDVTSVRDLLIMFSVGLTWIGTALFSGLLKENFGKDFSKSPNGKSMSLYGVVASALVGTSVFYLGHALIDGILYIESPNRGVSIVGLIIIALAICGKGFAEIAKNSANKFDEVELFHVARVCSPQTAILLSSIAFGFLYIWTENAEQSLIFSLMFTLPFYLAFISFGEGFALFRRLPARNILLESALIALVAILSYRLLSGRPLLLGDKTQFLLLISAIPGIVHAIYSAMFSESEKKWIMEQ
jgi:hypothetical protein